jgi:hypothetical protein
MYISEMYQQSLGYISTHWDNRVKFALLLVDPSSYPSHIFQRLEEMLRDIYYKANRLSLYD